jgi:activator of HSP90 ATPase
LNPAGCPEFSFVGTATARTPVLSNALTGPAILVSHGGAQFPDLVIVLQGEGIVLDLVGNTAIKKGITFSKFETVPDAPVSSFELDLPQSPHSALASPNGNLCGQNLVMPTFMEAQNGAQLHQNTQIEITGCGPKISITKKKLTGNSVSVTVKTSVKGVVTITGAGLRKTTKTLGAGSHTLKVPLTATGRTARNKHHKIKIKAALKAGKKTVSKSTGLKL